MPTLGIMAAAFSAAPALPDMTSTTTAVVNVVTSVLSLFEVYPLNVMLAISIGAYAFRFFRAGKKAVTT